MPDELARSDWDAMIMHYLGLDHIGHKAGPNSPNMLPKQQEMDGIVEQIYFAMETSEQHAKTLLVLAGDHGMNAGGNHGGSGPGETEPALLFASPKFKTMAHPTPNECPTNPTPGTEFRYYDFIAQSDLVPTLAALMGMPVSRNSLGVLAKPVLGLWPPAQQCRLLHQNAKQVLRIVHAAFGLEAFEEEVARFGRDVNVQRMDACEYESEGLMELACRWARVQDVAAASGGKDEAMREILIKVGIIHALNTRDERRFADSAQFLDSAQQTMSSAASQYNVSRLVLGAVLSATALVLAICCHPLLWPPSAAGLYFTGLNLLYGLMMFASSYVEEEQHFWYWATSAWFVVLALRRCVISYGICSGAAVDIDFFHRAYTSGSSAKQFTIVFSALLLLGLHRLSIRWNQTGQKYAGAPDVAHTFFPSHHILLWMLVLLTYSYTALQLATSTFAGIFPSEIAVLTALTLTILAVVFKLNFTQADAPELVGGLAERIREWSEPFDLVLQARLVFVLVAMSATAVTVLSVGVARLSVEGSGLSCKSHLWSMGTGQLADYSKAFAKGIPRRLHYLLTLFLMTQTRVQNIPLFLIFEAQRHSLGRLIYPSSLASPASGSAAEASSDYLIPISTLLLSQVSYFCFGGSNAISSIDLSNAYNGVAGYNVGAVGLLLFSSNWAGPIWWCSAGVLLLLREPSEGETKSRNIKDNASRNWVHAEREKLREDLVQDKRATADWNTGAAWYSYVLTMTVFVASSLLAVMAACTALRTHLFIWTVFSPKYLYAMAWCIGWHLGINVLLGTFLHWLGSVA